MKVLVTGGAGYIGSVVVEELLRQKKYQPVVLDNLQEGHREAVPPSVPFYHGDIGDRAILDRIFAEHAPKMVMHFAGEATVALSMKDPSRYFRTNVCKALTLLDVMRAHACNAIVFSSTAAVYGEPEYLPIDENHPAHPVNAYGESKLMFERLLAWYRRAYGLRYNIFRYFNAAGATPEHGEAHRTETHLIPLAFDSLVGRRGPFQVYGNDYPTPDGSCIRDFVHVLDLAQAHILALERIEKRPDAIYNLGTGKGYSVLEILHTIEKVTGRPVPYEIAPRRPGDPAVLVASSELAVEELGWRPQFSDIHEIVRTAWEWYQRCPNGYLKNHLRSQETAHLDPTQVDRQVI